MVLKELGGGEWIEMVQKYTHLPLRTSPRTRKMSNFGQAASRKKKRHLSRWR